MIHHHLAPFNGYCSYVGEAVQQIIIVSSIGETNSLFEARMAHLLLSLHVHCIAR
jgi:hypothetical protein